MFESLSKRLSSAFRELTGKGRLSEKNIQDGLKQVKNSLLEADVALNVVNKLMDELKIKAIGQEVLESVNPGDMLIKIVQDELVKILGDGDDFSLNLRAKPPAIILLAGLQGTGKTTMAAKLGKMLLDTHKKSVMLVSADVYRPAAIDQLSTLATQANLQFYPSNPNEKPVDIVNAAKQKAQSMLIDILIVDTAGRTHIDQKMMNEISHIHTASQPIETLFVVDSMTGQDAANTAASFHKQLPLTGVILTKTDADSRGGAALSVRHITGKPIKFLGTGEKLDDIDVFDPERIAAQILGMGDIVSLVQQVEKGIDKKKSAELASKLKHGGGFNFNDLYSQLEQMKNAGGMEKIMSKLPGSFDLPDNAMKLGEKSTKKMQVIIDSMTEKEKVFTDLASLPRRKKRIAAGSGTTAADINQLMKEFKRMQKMMKRFKGKKMQKMMNKFSGMMSSDVDTPH